MFRSKSRIAQAAVAALTIGVVMAMGPAAFAAQTSSTATITGGTLGLGAPATVAFTAVLGGVDQFVTAPQLLDVTDGSGAGAGWNVTATSTLFTVTTHTLAVAAVTEQAAPTMACDATVTCTLATNAVSYPYTLPAGVTAPTATKIISAAAATGLGGQTSTHTMRLSVPASTFAGVYLSTWTYSLTSGP
jgi:hypothetical protein